MPAGAQVAVTGAGVVGLSTAYALKCRGASVALYEPGEPGSGQSGGESRIFRHTHLDPRLVELAIEGRAVWREWEEQFARELLAPVGVVCLGGAAERYWPVLKEFGGVPSGLIDGQQLRERLPLLGPWEGPALLDEQGGVIRTAATIAALREALRDCLHRDEVLSVRNLPGGGVELRSGGDVHVYDRVVICAGLGTPALARSAGLEVPVRASAHVRLSYRVRVSPSSPLACVIDGSGDFGEPGSYADPLPGDAEYAVGLYDSPADERGGLAHPDDLGMAAQRTTAYVARAFPGLEPSPVAVRHCWVTELPWGEDGIGVWQEGGVSALAGSNMFKHAPAIGRALARAALGEELDARLHPDAQLGRNAHIRDAHADGAPA